MRYEVVGLGGEQALQITESSVGAGGAIVGAVIGGPIGAAVGAAIGLAAQLIGSLFQPNVQKIQASNDANQIEPILQQNLANWLSIPTTERYQSVQAAALNVFDSGWAQYVNLVTPLLSKAPDSISDRQQGSCAYHTAQQAGWSGTTYTGNEPNQPTGYCWNWFIGYRDPIANDPNVQPDPVAGTAGTTTTGGTTTGGIAVGGSDTWLLMLGGALILGGLLFLD